VAQIAIAERMGDCLRRLAEADPRAFDPRYKLTPKGEAATAASLMKGAKGSWPPIQSPSARKRRERRRRGPCGGPLERLTTHLVVVTLRLGGPPAGALGAAVLLSGPR
jgi:hypothetical protein